MKNESKKLIKPILKIEKILTDNKTLNSTQVEKIKQAWIAHKINLNELCQSFMHMKKDILNLKKTVGFFKFISNGQR